MSNIDKFDSLFAEYMGCLFESFPISRSISSLNPELSGNWDQRQLRFIEIPGSGKNTQNEVISRIKDSIPDLKEDTKLRSATLSWLYEAGYFTAQKVEQQCNEQAIFFLDDDGLEKKKDHIPSVVFDFYDGVRLTPKIFESLHTLPSVIKDESATSIGSWLLRQSKELSSETSKQMIKQAVSLAFSAIVSNA